MVTRKTIGIIGAGLAGAAAAWALARVGFDVTVFEAKGGSAQGSSGNSLGILHRLVSQDHNLSSQWVECGITTTLRWLDELEAISPGEGLGALGAVCGVLQMNDDCSELVSWDPRGAWISPRRFVDACLLGAVKFGAKINYNSRVDRVGVDACLQVCETDRGKKNFYFDDVVVCSASDLNRLLSDACLKLNLLRGTVSSYFISKEFSLPCVICASGYATPVVEGEMIVGASYERISESSEPSVSALEGDATDTNIESQVANIDRLRIISPKLAEHCAHLIPKERTSIRAATLDRMPHVGRVLALEPPLTPSISRIEQMPRSDRIWVLGGLGSRGLTSAPLGAEIIAALIRGRQAPVSPRLLNAVDPVRFALRDHQRRK